METRAQCCCCAKGVTFPLQYALLSPSIVANAWLACKMNNTNNKKLCAPNSSRIKILNIPHSGIRHQAIYNNEISELFSNFFVIRTNNNKKKSQKKRENEFNIRTECWRQDENKNTQGKTLRERDTNHNRPKKYIHGCYVIEMYDSDEAQVFIGDQFIWQPPPSSTAAAVSNRRHARKLLIRQNRQNTEQ